MQLVHQLVADLSPLSPRVLWLALVDQRQQEDGGVWSLIKTVVIRKLNESVHDPRLNR